jgi:hypothetical protein
MQRMTGIPRNQVFFSSLEDTILPENSVRFIDAFVEALSLETLDFSVQTIKGEGRPSFHNTSFLAIYLYGYINYYLLFHFLFGYRLMSVNLKRSILHYFALNTR